MKQRDVSRASDGTDRTDLATTAGGATRATRSGLSARRQPLEALVEEQIRRLPTDRLDLLAQLLAELNAPDEDQSARLAAHLQRLVEGGEGGEGAEVDTLEAEADLRDLLLMAETSLRVEWETPEEDAAWAHLADLPTQ